jgi:quinol monooxygenase YgiN
MYTRRSFLAGLLLAVITKSAVAQGKPNPDFEAIKAQLKDGNKPFTLTVRLEIKPGTGSQFAAAFAPAIKASRKEKGCIHYELSQDVANPTVYLLYERWKSIADLEAHMNGRPYQTLLREVGGLLTAREVKVLLPAAE